MKKVILAAAITLALGGCSTFNSDAVKAPNVSPTEDAIEYTQKFGKVEMTYDDEGNWITLTSSATAAIPIDRTAGLEQAMNVATMRANRNIIEFIKRDIMSNTTVDVMTSAMANDTRDNAQKDQKDAKNIATNIQERINLDAKGILRGVFIEERKLDSDAQMAVVTVKVTQRSVVASQALASSMGQ